ncbi:hypothetical protein GGR30_002070 [Martelella radicis]|uniref:Uncharacterized protein n=2 Tax=Martelella radicis TaxID=1397476 RepID=A0A7W6PA84_9HYPH|nr:hypothetical protein [Martelella radicis]
MSAECLCNSCRTAADRMEALPGAPRLREVSGGTRMEVYRKDRVRCIKGAEHLRAFRLNDKTRTRRAVAICCNTPVLLDVTVGHWVDLYGVLWPEGALPPLQLRTMAGTLDDPSSLPEDVPNLKTYSAAFFFRLMASWAAMGFRRPKIDYIKGEIDLSR